MESVDVVDNASELADLLAEAIKEPAADPSDRGRGALLGLAVGNLLGLPVEGSWYYLIEKSNPGGVTEIDENERHRPMDDDLAQAVELAESLLVGGDITGEFADRLVNWLRDNGRGCGHTTHQVIARLAVGEPPFDAARAIYEAMDHIAPNGGVMRCAPVAMFHHRQPALLVRDSAATCAVTHYAATCQWSCIIINAVIALLINGVTPKPRALLGAIALDDAPDLATVAHRDRIPCDVFDQIAGGGAKVSSLWLRRQQRLIGHTLLATQAGLWAVDTPLNFEKALVAMVSSGGDTDTNGAVAGAVLGARYGASAIPERWLKCIPERGRIEALADKLMAAGREADG